MMRIKQLREERGLSQRALALAIKANPKTVNFWEHGASEPTAGFIIALADFFECSADYLLGREDDMDNVCIAHKLTVDEQKLLSVFQKLDRVRRGEVVEFAEFLLSKPRFV